MGRGIVETGLGRTERLELEQRTTDPATTQQGEAWLRTDIAPATDQIATLRFDNGSGTWDVPVFDASASTTNVEKVLRVRVGGVTGFVPTTASGGAFSDLRLQHDGSTLQWHDSLEASVIPDSAINRWPIDEGSGTTVADVIGPNDGSISGPAWQSDANAIGGWILNYDVGDTGTVSSYTTNIFDGGGAIAFTVEFPDFSSNQPCWSKGETIGTPDDYDVWAGYFNPSNEFFFRVSDGSNHIVDITYGGGNLSSDTKYRVVCNWDGTTSADGAGLWFNNTEVNSGSASSSSPANVYSDLYFGWSDATNQGGSVTYSSNLLDEAVVFDSELSDSEIESDYNRQPWS